MNFGVRVAFDSGKCTGPRCDYDWSKYGYNVGCNNLGDYPFPKYDTHFKGGIWYSLPGVCPSMSYMDGDAQCAEQEPQPEEEAEHLWVADEGSDDSKEGDIVVASASSSDLSKFGIPVGHKNYAAAYCTGMLVARRALRVHAVDALQRGTQIKLTSVQSLSFELVDIMLRAGDEPRVRVLEWLGVILGSAEPRGKQGHVAPEGFNFWPQSGHHVIDVLLSDQASPFDKSFKNMLLLQALHAKIYGFPTSGAALNAFTLLLCR